MHSLGVFDREKTVDNGRQRLHGFWTKPVVAAPILIIAMESKRHSTGTPTAFVPHDLRGSWAGRFHLLPRVGVFLTYFLLFLSVCAFHFSDDSPWFSVLAAFLAVCGLWLGIYYRAEWRSSRPRDPDYDLREL